MSKLKIYHNGKWMDPGDLIKLNSLILRSDGRYEMEMEIANKLVVMESTSIRDKGEE